MRNDYVVYIHKNILNGKVYVGQTCNLSERWRNRGMGGMSESEFRNKFRDFMKRYRRIQWSMMASCH